MSGDKLEKCRWGPQMAELELQAVWAKHSGRFVQEQLNQHFSKQNLLEGRCKPSGRFIPEDKIFGKILAMKKADQV